MTKTIIVTSLINIFILLLVFHPWLALIAAYLLAGIYTIYLIGSEIGKESFRWPNDDQFEMFLVFAIMAAVWPIVAVMILTCEGYIQFHKPITFHKPKSDDPQQNPEQ